ncbi:MAG: anti-anti-sigma factor, partial [Oscillochloris sp.]|nr:anti-anti-sigma factor [Oscillochloris sp.]
MRNWFGILLFVASTNPDTRRRGRILISITLGVIGLGSSFIPLLLTSPQHTLILSIMGGVALLFLGGAYLGRQGRVTAGSYVMIGTAVIVILSSIYTNRSAPYGPFYLILAVLLAGVLLPPIQIWLVFLICAIGTVVVSGWLPTDIRTNPLWVQSLRGGPLLMLISSIIIFISARSASVAMRETQEARTEAEAAMQRLAENNAGLEARVAERTTELTRVLAEQQATMAQL